jgi:hypothetical protein
MTPSVRAFVLATAVAACGDGHAAAADSSRADAAHRVRQDSIDRAQPGYIIDSILPIEEQLRRFRADLPDTLRHFTEGESSTTALVRAFVRSLESADTAALLRLTISRAEFAWLVYPDSPLSRPPYRQAPDLVWMRQAAGGGTGLKRLLDRLGGARLGFRSFTCVSEPMIEGANRIWRDCAIQFATGDGTVRSLQLFSGIVERRGRFKILSYANVF